MTQTNIPRETDTALAMIYKRRSDANYRLTSALDTAHWIVGDQKNGRTGWRRSDTDVETNVRKLAETNVPIRWSIHNPTKTIEIIDAARAELARCTDDQRPLDAVYNATPWSRFFLVTSSNGHIHSSMSCSKCRVTTEFGWLPELSGMAEADVVAAHGPLLCTACFPSAPVEWTVGRPKAAYCPGTPDPKEENRQVGMHYRRCTCGYVAIVNANGSLRKHKPGA